MTILETSKNYELVSFIAGCRVWYAIRRISDREIIYCNNCSDNVKSEFDKL